MTKIIDGYAQPDIWAEKGDEKRCVFVETPKSLVENAPAIKKSIIWLGRYYPNALLDFYITKPHRE